MALGPHAGTPARDLWSHTQAPSSTQLSQFNYTFTAVKSFTFWIDTHPVLPVLFTPGINIRLILHAKYTPKWGPKHLANMHHLRPDQFFVPVPPCAWTFEWSAPFERKIHVHLFALMISEVYFQRLACSTKHEIEGKHGKLSISGPLWAEHHHFNVKVSQILM